MCLSEELMVQGNNLLQVEIMCVESRFRVLGESGHLNTRLHLAASGNRCSPPGEEIVKTRGRV